MQLLLDPASPSCGDPLVAVIPSVATFTKRSGVSTALVSFCLLSQNLTRSHTAPESVPLQDTDGFYGIILRVYRRLNPGSACWPVHMFGQGWLISVSSLRYSLPLASKTQSEPLPRASLITPPSLFLTCPSLFSSLWILICSRAESQVPFSLPSSFTPWSI